MTLQEVLSRLDVKNGSNGQYMARCPCHNDRQASLSVGIGGDGRVLLHCHAGCDTADIMASLGLTMRDLFVDLKPGDVFPFTICQQVKRLHTSKRNTYIRVGA